MVVGTLTVDYIVNCIVEVGLNPREQLYAYLQTGNGRYITRTGNARSLISQLDRRQIEAYLLA